jgi:hypothetical protein
VVGSCAGATVGLALAGPVGLVAGSLVGSQVGSHATQAAVSSNEDASPDDLILEQLDRGTTPNEEILRQMDEEETRRQPYRLGDFTRGVIARGKQASGRDADSRYQFGDLSRGLFARK